jgi:hypothetical protein
MLWKWASVSIGAPLLGTMEGRSFLRAIAIKRYVKMSCKQVSLSIWAPWGNLEGIHLLGLFERKRIVYLGSFLGPGGH